jgi:5-methylcytosine-specific restriction endonuclease McrA
MAYHSLKAKFFATSEGKVFIRAKPISRSLAREIYDRDNGICQKCGRKTRFGGNSVSPFEDIKSGAIDHIFPISRGGQNNKSNLRLLCMSCNCSKGAL